MSGPVRRWRGLPKPEEQEQLIESLRSRHARSSAAQRTGAATIEALEAEAEECAAVVRSLPALQEQHALSENKGERRPVEVLRAERESWAIRAFVSTFEQALELAIEEAEALEGSLALAREEAASARTSAASARGDLESCSGGWPRCASGG